MPDPDYRSFVNKRPGGSFLDEQEKQLREEWKAWRAKKDKKKPWYL